jgi:hypothetical protein
MSPDQHPVSSPLAQPDRQKKCGFFPAMADNMFQGIVRAVGNLGRFGGAWQDHRDGLIPAICF